MRSYVYTIPAKDHQEGLAAVLHQNDTIKIIALYDNIDNICFEDHERFEDSGYIDISCAEPIKENTFCRSINCSSFMEAKQYFDSSKVWGFRFSYCLIEGSDTIDPSSIIK